MYGKYATYKLQEKGLKVNRNYSVRWKYLTNTIFRGKKNTSRHYALKHISFFLLLNVFISQIKRVFKFSWIFFLLNLWSWSCLDFNISLVSQLLLNKAWFLVARSKLKVWSHCNAWRTLFRFGMIFAVNISQIEEKKLKCFSQMISITKMCRKIRKLIFWRIRKNITVRIPLEFICDIISTVKTKQIAFLFYVIYNAINHWNERRNFREKFSFQITLQWLAKISAFIRLNLLLLTT